MFSSRIAFAATCLVAAACGATTLFLLIAVIGKNLDLNRDLVAGLAIIGGVVGAIGPVVWLRRRAKIMRNIQTAPVVDRQRAEREEPVWLHLTKGKTSRLIIAGAICSGLLAFWLDLGRSPKLRVEDFGGAIRITNLQADQVVVSNVTINDRTDCKPILDLGIVSGYPKDLAGNPVPLKTGDSVSVFFVGCNVTIIKARVTTRSGTQTYGFD